MEKNQNSEQPLNQRNERIFDLFRTLKQDVREYSEQKKKEYDLTGTQLLVIDILNRNPGINLHALSEQLRLAKSNVSCIVERLVGKGIVVREIPEENRRTVKLSLSPEISERYNSMKYKNRFWSDMIRDASEEELNTVINGLEKLHELILRSKSEWAAESGETEK